jgi:hypothetical protein
MLLKELQRLVHWLKKGRGLLAKSGSAGNKPAAAAPNAFDAAATAQSLQQELDHAAARIEALDAAGVVTAEDMRIHICV